ncbi:MAG: efflux RND transporter periplasmic adaptor subunit [Pseudarcicella sp.]|nr:efflux RND transporter periplasmic adaptor subunit [Pseudarcicella sp.]MBP6410493.1 efflux RND transporter periplasmic adaptor subunit [Pseudarcicella sp.]
MFKKQYIKWWILGVISMSILGIVLAKKMEWIGKTPDLEVETTQVTLQNITESVAASGKIQPEIEIKISPDVSGEVVGLYINEGDSVTKGQLLLKIRPDNYEIVLTRAEAELNTTKASLEQAKAQQLQVEARMLKAKTDLDRNQKLFAQKVISEADLEQFESVFNISKQELNAAKATIQEALFRIKSAEAGMRESKINLTKTAIYAPQSGIISSLNVELGERVLGTSQMEGTELLTIANLNKMEVRVNVNENDISNINIGDSVEIDVDAFSNRKFEGLVHEMASSSNNNSGSNTDGVTEFDVKIKIIRSSYQDLLKTKNAHPLKPGMTASVEIITQQKNNTIAVPITSVTTRDPKLKAKKKTNDNEEQELTNKENLKEVVFIYDKGIAKLREVKTGIADFDNIEIISGLKKGETIISAPYLSISKDLQNGDKVSLKKMPKK